VKWLEALPQFEAAMISSSLSEAGGTALKELGNSLCSDGFSSAFGPAVQTLFFSQAEGKVVQIFV